MRMNKILQSGLAIVLAICLLLPGGFFSEAALAEDTTMDGTVRVYLSSLGSPSRLDITICGSYSLDGSGATALANGSTVTVGFNSTTGQLTLTQNGVTTAMGTDFRLRRHTTRAADNGVKISQARVSGNLYPGDLQFKSVRSGGVYKLYTIAHVFIEDYLCGVLPYEMGNSSPLESLKAQCVSARTYTVRAMNASTARSYDVVDTTNDQVYNGTPTPAPTENTSGKVLYGRVTTVKGSLNMRERASSNARVMRTIPQYETVAVLSRGYTWSQVTYQGATGYVMSSFLTFFEGEESAVTPTPAPAPVIPTVSQARVTTVSGPLNLRASIGGAVLKRIPQNDIVQVVERGTVWTQVTHEGTTGYVKTEFLTFLSDSTGSTPSYEEPMTELATPIAAQVTPQGSSIYLRAACDENATPVAIVLRGEYVLLTARGSVWCRIDYDGQTGYLPTRYLNIP